MYPYFDRNGKRATGVSRTEQFISKYSPTQLKLRPNLPGLGALIMERPWVNPWPAETDGSRDVDKKSARIEEKYIERTEFKRVTDQGAVDQNKHKSRSKI